MANTSKIPLGYEGIADIQQGTVSAYLRSIAENPAFRTEVLRRVTAANPQLAIVTMMLGQQAAEHDVPPDVAVTTGALLIAGCLAMEQQASMFESLLADQPPQQTEPDSPPIPRQQLPLETRE